MTMRFVPTTRITDITNQLVRTLFTLMDFLRTAPPTGAGWTVVRSSNGTTGGAGDNIATWSDLNNFVSSTSRSWFVLRSGDIGGGDAKELLFYRINTTNSDWACRTPRTTAAANFYTGGDVWNLPTSAGGSDLIFQMDSQIGSTATTAVIHMGADDAAPFGWWLYSHQGGDFGVPLCSMALIPITAGVQPGDVDPYLLAASESTGLPYWRDTAANESGSLYDSGIMGHLRPATGCTRVAALYFRNASRICVPQDGFPADENSDFLAFPIPFGRGAAATAPNGFKGWTDFLLWSAAAGATNGDTFETGSWVQWSSMLFPWDGSVPEIS